MGRVRQRGIKLPIHRTFFKKFVILGFFAGKSYNMIGHRIFHGDHNFFDLHEKSLYLSYYEIFPQKILKSRTFRKCGVLIVIKIWVRAGVKFWKSNMMLRSVENKCRLWLSSTMSV